MSRLAATMACDIRLQFRNGFYWAVAFLLAVILVLITRLPDFPWAPVLPPFVLGNLMTATFFFMAGLVLLEKGEGTLEAQIVTPLRIPEYLGSKLATLTALSVAENLIIVVIAHGTDFRVLPMTLGIVLASALYCLAGFVAVVRYESINQLLLPAMLWTTAFALPILHYAGLWTSPLMYVHPFQAPLVLISGGFGTLEAWEWAYGIGYSGVWIAIGALASRRRFQRFVISVAGDRKS